MPTSLLDHPTAEQLREFALGRVSVTEAERLGGHVEKCPICCARLTQVEAEADPLAQWLHEAGGQTPLPEHGVAVAPTLPGQHGATAAPPSLLGRYEILGELGRGGMGVVYKARDTQLKRLVAIKMIHQGALDGDTLARFHAEGLAVARLRHPHIVQLLEVGEERGSPYHVLEFLDGGSLAEHCRGRPQEIMYAARLVQTLAEAVEHAHAQGVIHRDLKPANVLLTAAGVAKVADFGLVKFDRAVTGGGSLPPSQTEPGLIVGTPHYMSPEQARGVPGTIGPSTDIYALGTILYHLLTGHAPFADIPHPVEVLQTLQEREPPQPHRHRPDLPRDLDVICMKCLALEPYRRYTSAGELATELGRFLRGEPIQARPLSWRQRAGRWCRRNPVVAGLLGGLAGVIAAALAGLTWLYLDADVQRRRAEEQERDARTFAREAQRQKAEADKQREDALEYFDIARRAVETFHTRVMADPKLRENNFHPLRTALLESTIRFHEALINRRTEDPRLQAAQGRAWRHLGELRQELGQHDDALHAFAQAAAVFTPLTTIPDLRRTSLKELAGAHQYRALLLGKLGRTEESLTSFRAISPLLETVVREFPDDRHARFNLLACRANHARILADTGRRDEAIAFLRANVPLMEEIAATTPTPEFRAGLGALHSNLGSQYMDNRQFTAGVPHFQRSHEVFRLLVADYPRDPRFRFGLAQTCGNLGGALNELGRGAEAEAPFREGQRLTEELVREHPNVLEYRVNWGSLSCNLAGLYKARQQGDQALAAYDIAVRELTAVLARAPRLQEARTFLANAYSGRAEILEQQGRHADALRDWAQVHTLAPDPTRALRYAAALLRQEQVPQGIAILEKALPDPASAPHRAEAARLWSLAATKATHPSPGADRCVREALRLLQALAAEGHFRDPAAARQLRTLPEFAPIRQLAEYDKLFTPLPKEMP